jgi:hypothetical protein
MARANLIVALVLALPVVAETPSRDLSSPERFFAYGDNFVLRQKMQNNGWAGDDEWALRAHYSFRYDLYDNRTLTELNKQDWDKQEPGFMVFLSYTGEFDFYMGTRPSGPVINRISNPGLHYRYSWPISPAYAEIGVEHRSDGQVVEVTNRRDAELAHQAYLQRDRAYFDQISRGSNFVSIAGRYSTRGDSPWTFYTKVRIYFQQDSDVTWGPLAGQDIRISDYDRATIRVVAPDIRFGQFDFQATLGDKLGNSSFEAGWQAPTYSGKFSFPVFVRFHSGPMNTLSNYTQRQNSIGIGLRLNWIGRSSERAMDSLFTSIQ